MSSRQLDANRKNARASTGPKTAAGKARVGQNARRHGLALSVMADPNYTREVEPLARSIAHAAGQPELLFEARRVAEAQIDLARIRQTRHDRLISTTAEVDQDPARCSGRSAAAPTAPGGDRTFAAVEAALSAELLSELLRFDRYERRALSRRKFAVRELVAAVAG